MSRLLRDVKTEGRRVKLGKLLTACGMAVVAHARGHASMGGAIVYEDNPMYGLLERVEDFVDKYDRPAEEIAGILIQVLDGAAQIAASAQAAAPGEQATQSIKIGDGTFDVQIEGRSQGASLEIPGTKIDVIDPKKTN